MKTSKLARTLKQGRKFSSFSGTDNAAGVPLVRVTGMDVHVKHEIKHGILTEVNTEGEAPGILLHDSVGSVEMLQELRPLLKTVRRKEDGEM